MALACDADWKAGRTGFFEVGLFVALDHSDGGIGRALTQAGDVAPLTGKYVPPSSICAAVAVVLLR